MRYIVTDGSQWFVTSNDIDNSNLMREIEQECKLRNMVSYNYKEYVEEVNDGNN